MGATAIDLFLLKRGIFGKPSATPQSIGNLNLSKVFRVQGGELPKASKFRMFIGNEGKIVVNNVEGGINTGIDLIRLDNGRNSFALVDPFRPRVDLSGIKAK